MLKADISILRDLASEYMQIASLPVMDERRKLWTAHNDLKASRPLVLIESNTPYLQEEIFRKLPLRCGEPWAKQIEAHFRGLIYHFRHIDDDDVAVPEFRINWKIEDSGYGVKAQIERQQDREGRSLGFHWEAPIKDIVNDFHLLKHRSFSVDRDATMKLKKDLDEVFGYIIPVKIRGQFWWTLGLTNTAVRLIGLENMMMYMYDQPDALHRLMSFLRDDHLSHIEFCEREGILSLNNDGDYVGAGGRGFTAQLPQKDFCADSLVRLKDMWGLSESQETVGISPDMFAEFILPYQKAITRKFGLVYYGCCEPLHSRISDILTIDNLRTVSVSPWADENIMAEMLGRKYVYSRKPNPSLLSTGCFNEDELRMDIRKTLNLTRSKGCNVEIVMKDLHTTSDQPERMGEWVKICREEIKKSE